MTSFYLTCKNRDSAETSDPARHRVLHRILQENKQGRKTSDTTANQGRQDSESAYAKSEKLRLTVKGDSS